MTLQGWKIFPKEMRGAWGWECFTCSCMVFLSHHATHDCKVCREREAQILHLHLKHFFPHLTTRRCVHTHKARATNGGCLEEHQQGFVIDWNRWRNTESNCTYVAAAGAFWRAAVATGCLSARHPHILCTGRQMHSYIRPYIRPPRPSE